MCVYVLNDIPVHQGISVCIYVNLKQQWCARVNKFVVCGAVHIMLQSVPMTCNYTGCFCLTRKIYNGTYIHIFICVETHVCGYEFENVCVRLSVEVAYSTRAHIHISVCACGYFHVCGIVSIYTCTLHVLVCVHINICKSKKTWDLRDVACSSCWFFLSNAARAAYTIQISIKV